MLSTGRIAMTDTSPNVFAVPVADLSPTLVGTWAALTELAPDCSSPFLHPEYARTLGIVRPGVEVAVIKKDGEAVGFLPFERTAGGIGRSIGARLCDRAGAVVRPDVEWSVGAVAKAAGLRMLRLANVSTDEGAFDPYFTGKAIAPYIDLTDGYDAYRTANIRAGSGTMKRIDRRSRKLEGMLGPLRLVWHDTDDAVLGTLLRWKAKQRQATRSPNVFDLPWAKQLLALLRNPGSDDFSGVLSTLYAGDTLCAAHFGIRSRRVLHYWLAAYDEELGRCSPGLLLLMRMAEEAAERGIARLDLGPGDEEYKIHISSGHEVVATATACTGPAMASVVRAAETVRLRARQSGTLRATRRSLIRGAYLIRSSFGNGSAEA
jgi:CelD/BcsL family acetyltransferase involved in cellulose biosynthesis